MEQEELTKYKKDFLNNESHTENEVEFFINTIDLKSLNEEETDRFKNIILPFLSHQEDMCLETKDKDILFTYKQWIKVCDKEYYIGILSKTFHNENLYWDTFQLKIPKEK